MKARIKHAEMPHLPEELAAGRYCFGRAGEQVVLLGPGLGDEASTFPKNYLTVSRIRPDGQDGARGHLEMQVDQDHRVTLRDQKSANGSYLNGHRFETQRVDKPGTYLVRLGDLFQFELVLTE